MSRMYRDLVPHSTDAARAAWEWAARTEDDELATWLLRRDDAPQEVLDGARDSRRPAVRAAWLLRPGRTDKELADALARERRGDVLAAVASATDDTSMQLQLAKLDKRPVALVQAERVADPDVLALVAVTLDKWCQNRKAPRRATSAMRTVAHRLPEDRLATATAWTSWDALAKLAERTPSDRAVVAHLCTTLVPAAVERLGSWDYQATSAATATLSRLVESPYLTSEQLTSIADALAVAHIPGYAARNVTPLIAKARQRATAPGEAVSDADELQRMLAEGSAEEVLAAWTRLTAQQRRDRRIGDSLVANTSTPAQVQRELLRHQQWQLEHLAAAVDVDLAAEIVSRGGLDRLTELRPELRAPAVAAALAKANYSEVVSVCRQLTVDELLATDWPKVAQSLPSGGFGEVQARIASTLGASLNAWAAFEAMQGTWPGSLEALLDTCLASTTAA